jgi:hypothetical protein
LGIALGSVGIAALIGTQTFWRGASWLETVQEAMRTENEMVDAKREEKQITESEVEHKRWKADDPDLQGAENEGLRKAWRNASGQSAAGALDESAEPVTALPAPTR